MEEKDLKKLLLKIYFYKENCYTSKCPIINIIQASYLINGDTSIIELAQSCGSNLYPRQLRDPLSANTYGFGQIIIDALNYDISKFVLTLVGSGTNDVGIGLL